MEPNKKAEIELNLFLKNVLNLCKMFVKSMGIEYILAIEGVINI